MNVSWTSRFANATLGMKVACNASYPNLSQHSDILFYFGVNSKSQVTETSMCCKFYSVLDLSYWLVDG